MKYFYLIQTCAILLTAPFLSVEKTVSPYTQHFYSPTSNCEIRKPLIVKNQLVRYYTFTYKGSQNIEDFSSSNIPALAHNISPTTDSLNRSNKAFNFKDAYVDIDDLEGDMVNEITISLWVKTNDTVKKQAIVSSILNTGVELYTPGFPSKIQTDQGTISILTQAQKPLNQWRHYVFVCKSGDSKVFEDGVQIGQSSATYNFIRSSNIIRVGGKFDGNDSFDGKIDEVMIYKRALNIAEIQNIYTNYSPLTVKTSYFTPINDVNCNNYNISVNNTQPGFLYHLINENNGATVDIKEGNDNTINFVTGILSEPTNYSLLVKPQDTSNCSNYLQVNNIINIQPILTNLTVRIAGNSVPTCNSAVDIWVNNSQTGIKYQLQRKDNLLKVGNVQIGNNDRITLTAPSNSLNDGDTEFQVVATNPNINCEISLNQSIIIPNRKIDDNKEIEVIQNGCEGSEIKLNDSETGVFYQIINASNGTAASTFEAGNGAQITLSFSPETPITRSTKYAVKAIKGTPAICNTRLKQEFTLHPNGIISNKTVRLKYASDCGKPTEVTILNAQEGISYQLKNQLDNQLIGEAKIGQAADLSLTIPLDAITQTNGQNIEVVANYLNKTCPVILDKSFRVYPNKADTSLKPIVNYGSICQAPMSVDIFQTKVGFSYQLLNLSTNQKVSDPVAGGSKVELHFNNNLTTTTSFKVIVTNTNTGCRAFLPSFEISPNIVDTSLFNQLSYKGLLGNCLTAPKIKINNPQTFVTYKLLNKDNNSVLDPQVERDANSINLIIPNSQLKPSGSIWVVRAINQQTNCEIDFAKEHRIYPTNINQISSNDVSVDYDKNCLPKTQVRIANIQPFIEYTLWNDAQNQIIETTQFVEGTILILEFKNELETSTSYKIQAHNPNTGCQTLLDVVIPIKPQFVNNNLPNTLIYNKPNGECLTAPKIKINNPQTFVTYKLLNKDNNSVLDPQVERDANSINLIIPNSQLKPSGSIWVVRAINQQTNCEIDFAKEHRIYPTNINQISSNDVSVDYDKNCLPKTQVRIANIQPFIEYTLWNDAQNQIIETTQFVEGTILILEFKNELETSTSYKIQAHNPNTGCQTLLDVVIPIKPQKVDNKLPNELIYGNCNISPKIVISSPQAYVEYSIKNLDNQHILTPTVILNQGKKELIIPNNAISEGGTRFVVLAKNTHTECEIEFERVHIIRQNVAIGKLDISVNCGISNSILIKNSPVNAAFNLFTGNNVKPTYSFNSGNGGELVKSFKENDNLIPTVYRIQVINNFTGCATFQEKAITLHKLVTNLVARELSATKCRSSSSIELVNSQLGVTYFLVNLDKGEEKVSKEIDGNGGTIYFSIERDGTPTTVNYQIKAISKSTRCTALIGSNISINQQYIKTDLTPEINPQGCVLNSQKQVVTIDNTLIGVEYRIVEKETNLVIDRQNGNNGKISFEIFPSSLSNPRNLVIKALNQNCEVEVSQTPFTLYPHTFDKTKLMITRMKDVACDDTVRLRLAGTSSHLKYQLRNVNTGVNLPEVTGNGNDLILKIPSNTLQKDGFENDFDLTVRHQFIDCSTAIPNFLQDLDKSQGIQFNNTYNLSLEATEDCNQFLAVINNQQSLVNYDLYQIDDSGEAIFLLAITNTSNDLISIPDKDTLRIRLIARYESFGKVCSDTLPDKTYYSTDYEKDIVKATTTSGEYTCTIEDALYQWYFKKIEAEGVDFMLQTNETSKSYRSAKFGFIKVEVTKNGCTWFSDSVYYQHNNPVGIEDSLTHKTVISPNPTNGLITIAINSPNLIRFKQVSILLQNQLGQEVFQKRINHKSYKSSWLIDLTPLPVGMYSLLLHTDQGKFFLKRVVKK